MPVLLKYILLGLFFCLASCMTDLEIDMKPTPPKLVLNTSVGAGQELTAHLSRSWFITELPVNEVPEGAAIRVFLNGEDRGLMQLADNPDNLDLPKGQYRLPGCYPQSDDHLRLEAKASGMEPVASKLIVPKRTEIAALDTVLLNTDYNWKNMQLYLTFSDRANEKNYYRLVVRKETEYWKGDSLITTVVYGEPTERVNSDYLNNYHNYGGINNSYYYKELFFVNHTDPVFRPQGSNGLPDKLESYSSWGCFADETIDGQTYVLEGEIGGANYSFKGDSVTSIVHYDICLYSITDAYYQYMKAVWHYALNDFDLDALKEPYSAYSNVEGGYGVVSAYQIASRRITMPFGTTAPYWTPYADPKNPYQEE